MRTPDKPGTYRIRQKGGDWILSGLSPAGRRVKQAFGSESEARAAVPVLFSSRSATAFTTAPIPSPLPSVDDWGIPLVQADTMQAVADAMGVPPPLPPQIPLPGMTPPLGPQQLPNPEEEKKARENRERTKTLCEFFGIGWASVDVWLAKRMTVSLGKEPLQPSIKQVNKLADATQDALTSLFGDREIGPWTMAVLLSIALPMSMIMQSPKAPPKTLEESQRAKEPNPNASHLSAV